MSHLVTPIIFLYEYIEIFDKQSLGESLNELG